LSGFQNRGNIVVLLRRRGDLDAGEANTEIAMKKLLIALTAVLAVGLYTASGAYAHHERGGTKISSSFNGNFNNGSGNGNGNGGYGNVTVVPTQNNNSPGNAGGDRR
jgi:hypothetical protein